MRPRKGQMVKVVFDDHVEGADTLLQFVAYGRVAKVTKLALTIDCWHYYMPHEERGSNIERFTIIRSAIHRLVELEEKDA